MGSWANIRSLKAVLLLFEGIFGLKVNFPKNMLFGVNVVDSWLQEETIVLNCNHGCIPFLDCPLVRILESFIFVTFD